MYNYCWAGIKEWFIRLVGQQLQRKMFELSPTIYITHLQPAKWQYFHQIENNMPISLPLQCMVFAFIPQYFKKKIHHQIFCGQDFKLCSIRFPQGGGKSLPSFTLSCLRIEIKTIASQIVYSNNKYGGILRYVLMYKDSFSPPFLYPLCVNQV